MLGASPFHLTLDKSQPGLSSAQLGSTLSPSPSHLKFVVTWWDDYANVSKVMLHICKVMAVHACIGPLMNGPDCHVWQHMAAAHLRRLGSMITTLWMDWQVKVYKRSVSTALDSLLWSHADRGVLAHQEWTSACLLYENQLDCWEM